jgi:hypothetical protein
MLFEYRYATGCFADGTVIGEPANALTITSATPTNVSCNNDNSTTILAAGGTPNYTYAAVAGATARLLMQHLIWLWLFNLANQFIMCICKRC